MADKCPICYRNLGTWKKDPILLPNGAPYDWISNTELVYEPDINNRWYRGVYQISEPEVQELQDALKVLELENLDIGDRTTFSPLNTSGKFQITGKHIKEMRDSVEKLLEAMGITKPEYFNYDEENNHIIHPNGDKVEWIDPITSSTDLIKFQVKGIHIEDLRHVITNNFIYICATTNPGIYKLGSGDSLQIVDSYVRAGSSIAIDNNYIYLIYQDNSNVYKCSKVDCSIIDSCYVPPEAGFGTNRMRALCVDDKYIWLSREIPYGGYGSYITQIDKLTMTIVNISIYFQTNPAWWIGSDNNFVYTNRWASGSAGRIEKIDKITYSVTPYILEDLFYPAQNVTFGSLGIDENYFYFIVVIKQATNPWAFLRARLLLINRTFTTHTEIDVGITQDPLSGWFTDILVDNQYIYLLYSTTGSSSSVELRVIKKTDYSIVYTTTTIEGQVLHFDDILGGFVGGKMASEYSYRKRLTF